MLNSRSYDCFDTAFVLAVILVVDGLPRITLYEELFSILESDIDILFAKICHDTYGAVDPPASAIVFREHYLCTNLQCECLVGHFGSHLCLSGADGLVGF